MCTLYSRSFITVGMDCKQGFRAVVEPQLPGGTYYA
jgi:hypothetical protein